MRVFWICGLPRAVQDEVLGGVNHGAEAAWSWVLGHLPPPAGVELHIACRTARHTAARDFIYRGAHFHLVPVRARARVYCLFQFDWRYFRELVARLQPDIIHGWGTEDSHALTALKLAPERHLIQIQGNLNTYRKRLRMPWPTVLAAWSERLALARARHVVAENEYSLESARPMFRTAAAHVIEHPIRPEFLRAVPADGAARQILFLGSVEERKGIWDALEAFRAGAPDDWTLAVAGNGSAPAVARLRRWIAEAKLESRVRHHPQLNPAELVSLMQSASVFLLPTRIDTGPTALKEALAMGLWPVCYDNSGPGHYLRKFGCGDLAADLSVPALTETLKRALAAQAWRQPEHRAKIAAQIRPHFDAARIWPELVRLYEGICHECRPR
ncbi:MAG: glycosyltransferase [Verrucomicrobia bacterium]|nr:glycosyltransferase [Verrucomicrobiota bacterium]